MKLVLYSGGSGRENRLLAEEVSTLLQEKRSPVLTFVPASSEYAAEDFREFRSFPFPGVKKQRCIAIDKALSKEEEKELFSSDAIFLGGGNTFYFLQSMREHKLLPKFREYVKKGGILLGLSAGSILMTPNIMMAALPKADSDDNDVGLKNFSALGLVPFEFAPHYSPSAKRDEELKKYSKKLSHPLYACADGQGIVVKDGAIHFVGKVSVFHQGLKYRIQ